MLGFILSILFISTSYSQESNDKGSDFNEIYSTKEMPKYRLGIELSGEIYGIGPVIELFPQKKVVFGLAIGTNIVCVTGAVRFRIYSEIDKTSPFFGVGYGGLYLIPEETVFLKPKYMHWVFCNIGIRFIFKSNSAFSINVGAIRFLNYFQEDNKLSPIFGVEYLWK